MANAKHEMNDTFNHGDPILYDDGTGVKLSVPSARSKVLEGIA
jgi:hypothetical protein